MFKKAFIIFALMIVSLLPLAADDITFDGGESRISLKEGREEVLLTGGATVKNGSLTIKSDEIKLTGKDWTTITCSGNVSISDEERGITIITSSLWFDREAERLLISTYFELSDTTNEMTASASSLEYRMEEEMLTLAQGVTLSKVNEDDVIRCRAEKMSYSRNEEKAELRGGAKVTFKGNDYEAESISLDIKNDRITLSEKIRGNINA